MAKPKTWIAARVAFQELKIHDSNPTEPVPRTMAIYAQPRNKIKTFLIHNVECIHGIDTHLI